ncbi:helix-turn-helix domain-containing protein [Pantoea sp. Tr-811]|uniref:Fic family protein n=1 Tax=Pantoea sp. Tr-811 TaxID=2608361 RepID=UPI001423D94C|nr:Fic family protein [Pantoea sp. Tr-811]NIF28693.1 helix-turn-helix domain-containing protein [Pantoea sp. Tr-811]
MTLPNKILTELRRGQALSSRELAERLDASWSTVKRHLELLLDSGKVEREKDGRTRRYRQVAVPPSAGINTQSNGFAEIPWSPQSRSLRASLLQPLAMREVVTYQRELVDNYQPNHSAWLPRNQAAALEVEGQMRGQQPAGTYARKVLEPLLIDLSWSSSRLEGNRYSLLDTERLFKSGVTDGDLDAVMLLNHKAAIEFMVDAVPEYGLNSAVISNLHALLMQDLLADGTALGSIRQTVVNISGTTYFPTQLPSLLEEMFERVLDKARQIKNPIEAAFFLWINLAYLQPFEDGNKRTSRLAANIPLMLYNCSPLSFLDVDPQDYALAMMGVYEQRDMAMAADLFVWVYRRSISKYGVMIEAMGVPDPVRLHYREWLNEAINAVVRERLTVQQVVGGLDLSAEEKEQFEPLLRSELKLLALHNCARYRLSMKQVKAWIDAGRPGDR